LIYNKNVEFSINIKNMTKEKRSFLERLTGARRIDEERSMPVYAEEEETEMVMRNSPPRMAQAPQESWSGNQAEEADADGQLTIDVYQTENDIVIKSTIAGVKPEDLDVSISNDMITIKGERKNEEVVENENYYYQECYWGSFSRSVVLPVDVISEKAEASLKNGILTIRLPKADATRTKKIQVRGF
jgi:HSP20 family protein